MTHHPTYLTNNLLVASCFALTYMTGAVTGCGSSGDGAPTVDSDLLGIYEISTYQGSQDGCDDLTELDGARRLALYSIPSSTDPEEAILLGQFCGSVDNCRVRVTDLPTAANYSFFEGSDATGWLGWGIASEGMAGDQCLADVQEHSLTSTAERAITIDTRQVETVFKPAVPDGTNTAICSIRDAIASIDDQSPCTKRFLLEATFETAF